MQLFTIGITVFYFGLAPFDFRTGFFIVSRGTILQNIFKTKIVYLFRYLLTNGIRMD